MKKFIFMLMVIAIFVSCSVSANSLQYNLSMIFNDETKALSISGKIGNEDKLPVTVMIDTYSAEGKSFSVDSLPLIVDMYKLGEGGTADFAVPIPADMPSGKYTVYFNCAGVGKYTGSFIIPAAEGSNELTSALDAVNSSSDSGMFSALTEHGVALGFDVEAYSEEELLYIGSLLYAWRESDYTASDFASAIRKASVINSLKKGESLTSLMDKNADVFGVTFEDFATLKDSTKVQLEKFLPKADFNNNSSSQIYTESLALSKITGSENWVEMRDEILAHESILGLYLADYESLSSIGQNKVFTGIFDGKNDVSYLVDIKNMFDEEVEAQLPQNNYSGGSSGGGGGGGGSFVSKGTIIASPEIMKPVFDAPKAEPDIKPAGFSDIENHFSKDAVETFVSLGIVSGYPDGTFRPDAPVTRAEFAKMAVMAFEIKDSGETSFSDVDEDDWFAPYIKSLYVRGVLKGYDGYAFPANNLKREDAAVMIHRLMAFNDSDVELTYFDKELISDYALGAVSSLFEKEIMRGDGTSFNPKNIITRGEVVVLLSNAVSHLDISEGGE